MKSKLMEFLRSNTKESMARLLTLICGIAGFLLSVGAIGLGIKNNLSFEYVSLCLGVWGAAFGGKNWAKSIELKKQESNGQ